jgi:hypothetical protein
MMDTFDYLKFAKQRESLREEYLLQKPYPYAIFDGLFSEELISAVNDEIDRTPFEIDERNISNIEVKKRSNFRDNEDVPKNVAQIFSVLNGGKFLELISELTSIEGLISDPYFDGGGVNIIENEGTLAVHVDGTTQHRMNLSRRLNVILFLNHSWDPAWNGYHEQWEYLDSSRGALDVEQRWRCVRKILPKSNRLLVFTTNDHSWHGHAGHLSVPREIKRRSLIAYYYTASRPRSDGVFEAPHRALFVDNKITLRDSAFLDTEIVL